MTIDAGKALQLEADFLAGVEANLDAAKGRQLRGSIWERSQNDEGDRLRALMAEHRNYDRERLRSLPSNRRVALHGFERRFLFGKRRTGVAIASVLSPLSHYASGASGEAPPISLGELQDHVRRLVTNPRVPHIIGVCSPTGFTDEARHARIEAPNLTVVLVEPDDRGGWQTSGPGGAVDSRLLRMFDPESARQKVARVRSVIGERHADLITGGVSVETLARDAGLAENVVREACEQAVRDDPELRLSNVEGQWLLFRGASSRQENRTMNVIDRIRQLFSGEGDENAKVNLLAERRASLSQRRDRMYEAIVQLEKKEAQLLADGKSTPSAVTRRRIAAQLAQLRKDIARQNAAAAMLNQQINIISTDIHNLTLIQQGRAAKLPDTEELTEHAVAAEEMLETLRADSEMVGGLETGMEASLVSAEELEILKELEGTPPVEETEPEQKTPARQAPTREEVASIEAEFESPPAAEEEPPAQPKKSRPADPEPS
ncbi:MAG: hypothetical protein J5J06_02535 [Phycisphaerae bacterium]|nr:hypothetical protein [Phycisphaerae bacterium]